MNVLIEKMLAGANGMFRSWMERRTYAFPKGVEEIRDVPYLPDGESFHRMDIYRPKHAEKKLPVIVNLHGGGLVLCQKDVNRPVCAEFAKRGFLVFCVDYPLVPQRQVPEILADVCAGMDAVDALLEEYGGDRERVFLVGDSAGAFLAVYAAAAQKSEAIAAAAGVKSSALSIQAMGLICGMFHTAETDATGFWLRKDFYGTDWRRHPLLPYLKPEKPEVASLMPPCFLVTSRADKLHRSTCRFHRGLQEAGIACILKEYVTQPHDFVIINPESEASQESLDAMTHFLIDKTKKMY